MTTSDRRTVHVCEGCHAVFEGPAPPATCPGCRQPANWRTAEVGAQEGVVGGRVFVPGTTTPLTRTFFCRKCATLNVTRDGSVPVSCKKCADVEAQFTEATPSKKIAIDDTPVVKQETKGRYEDATRPSIPPSKWPLERSVRETQTAEEYRSEWIAERMAAAWDRGGESFLDEYMSRMWTLAEQLYDEGKKRGHLP